MHGVAWIAITKSFQQYQLWVSTLAHQHAISAGFLPTRQTCRRTSKVAVGTRVCNRNRHSAAKQALGSTHPPWLSVGASDPPRAPSLQASGWLGGLPSAHHSLPGLTYSN